MGLPLMWLNGPRASRVECLLDGERNDAVKSFGVSQSWTRWLMMMSLMSFCFFVVVSD